MSKAINLDTNADNRSELKELQRKHDLYEILEKKRSRTEIQKRNSIFSQIKWSEVTIFEPDGCVWSASDIVFKAKA